MLKATIAILFSFNIFAVDMKPMNIEPGLWSSKTEMDTKGMMAQMLAKVPKEQRAMVEKMMAKSIKNPPATEACMPKEMINNPQKAFEEQMAKNKQDCELKVIESTDSLFKGKLFCKGQKFSGGFTWKAINRKRTETTMDLATGQGKQNFKIISTWIKSDCPASKTK